MATKEQIARRTLSAFESKGAVGWSEWGTPITCPKCGKSAIVEDRKKRWTQREECECGAKLIIKKGKQRVTVQVEGEKAADTQALYVGGANNLWVMQSLVATKKGK